MRMKVETKQYKSEPTYKLISSEIARGINIQCFLPKGNVDALKAWNELVHLSKGMRFTPRKIAGQILMEHHREFINLPMNQTGSFSRTSGIIEATLNLVKSAIAMADILPVDKDLLVAGAMLYYVGNTKTINSAYNYTPDDILLTSGNIASEMILLKYTELQNDENFANTLDAEDVRILRHIVTSRITGIKTAVPEALILRQLDIMIQETDIMTATLKNMDSGTIAYNNQLFNHSLYKRTMKQESDAEFKIA